MLGGPTTKLVAVYISLIMPSDSPLSRSFSSKAERDRESVLLALKNHRSIDFDRITIFVLSAFWQFLPASSPRFLTYFTPFHSAIITMNSYAVKV